jgi:hypothetical protein
MTLFGKILVMLNLALAVMLAAWSFNLYSNGVDWTDSKSKGTPPVPTGQYAIRAAKLDELWKGVAPTQADWLRERGKLAEEERRLNAERAWYDREIRYVWVGPAKGKGISQVAIAAKDDEKTGVKKGQVQLDPQGFPQMASIVDPMNVPLQLQSMAEYNEEDKGILSDIDAQIKRNVQQIAESNALTDRIIGDKDRGIRGLQQRINDEQAKNAALIAEMKLVEPQLLNTLVEAHSINKRHDQMVKRIEELKKLKVAGK